MAYASSINIAPAKFGLLGVTTEHRMTMGVEYGHALSVSRRLSLRADVTPTRTTLPASVTGSVERLDKIDTALTFTYPIRLGWETAATYQRGFEYVAGLEAPIFVDAARVNLNGLIGRRIDVHATAAYVDGISAYRQNDQLEGYTANVRMRLAWTRSVAAFSEYVYYRYNFQARLLAVDLPSSFEQNSVRVGLAFWTSFR